MINKDKLIYKLKTVIEYLKNNGGYDYKLYNHLWPGMGEPNSNDVLSIINLLSITNKNKLYLNKYYHYIIKNQGSRWTHFVRPWFLWMFPK